MDDFTLDQLREQLSGLPHSRPLEAAALAGTGHASSPPAAAQSTASLWVRGLLFAAVGVAVLASLTLSRPTAPAPSSAGGIPTRMEGGAASIDELLQRFIDALNRSDADTFEALRVTESEYRYLIVPGHVAEGENPPRPMTDEAHEYFYAVMNEKSFYHRQSLVRRYGGKHFTLDHYEFEKGVKEYAGHTQYKRLVLELRDDAGATVEIRTGSIVERDGRFKFASYIRD